MRNSYKGSGELTRGFKYLDKGSAWVPLIGLSENKKGAQGPVIFIVPTNLDLIRALGASCNTH